ncbi:MAG: DUF3256 family protein [Bacteroidaceae bacterium]|nr:DUF3256 family protein [Bacteroidaceae bacterium]
MTRILSVLIVCLSVIGPVRAEDLRTLFIGMPDSIMPMLTKSERMDFLDYMDSGMRARARNKQGGESEMTLFKDNMLSVKTSQSGRMDMALFRKKDGSNLICIINTVTARYDDSRLAFFTEKWEPVPVESLIELPQFDDYLTKEALKRDSLEVLKKESILRLQSAAVTDGGLEFSYTSLEYIGEDADYFSSWFRKEPILYTWNGKQFKRK